MEITEELIHQIANKPLDYIHVSLMDVNSVTREGKYKVKIAWNLFING